ncbi:MAG: hypothetical protein OWU84_14725 [Firmicutes bacterium]|nr:hypothetical protein [Bacillota bacterium]
MTDHSRLWRIDNDGNLARHWNEEVHPKHRGKVRRRFKRAWVGTAVWIASLWLGGLGASGLAIHSMTLSYQYDQLNQRYADMTRENQTLAAEIASLTSAPVLARDAARLHVTLVHPKPAAFLPPAPHHRAKPSSWLGRVTAWIRHLGQAAGQ